MAQASIRRDTSRKNETGYGGAMNTLREPAPARRIHGNEGFKPGRCNGTVKRHQGFHGFQSSICGPEGHSERAEGKKVRSRKSDWERERENDRPWDERRASLLRDGLRQNVLGTWQDGSSGGHGGGPAQRRHRRARWLPENEKPLA